MNARRATDPNRKPWFWGFVGRTALATVVAWLTLVLLSLLGLLLFGGALLGMIGLGSSSSSEDTSTSQEATEDYMLDSTPTAPADQEVPVVLSATSTVPAEVTWSIGNETATETFTGEWSKEGVTNPSAYESLTVDVTPVDYATADVTCTITVDGQPEEEGSGLATSSGTYCYA